MSYFSLFTSVGTLLCCALPSLMVMLGLGATLATVVSDVPWLAALSHHKNQVFALAGSLIALNYGYVYALGPRIQARAGSCDQENPRACITASRASRVVLWCSLFLYGAGFFSAYLLGPILIKLNF